MTDIGNLRMNSSKCLVFCALALLIAGCRQDVEQNQSNASETIPQITSVPAVASEASAPEVTSEIEQELKESLKQYDKELGQFDKRVEELKNTGKSNEKDVQAFDELVKKPTPKLVPDEPIRNAVSGEANE